MVIFMGVRTSSIMGTLLVDHVCVGSIFDGDDHVRGSRVIVRWECGVWV